MKILLLAGLGFASLAAVSLWFGVGLPYRLTSRKYEPPVALGVSERLIAVEVDASFIPKSIGEDTKVTWYEIQTGPRDGSLNLLCPPELDPLARERPGPQRYRLEYWEIEHRYSDHGKEVAEPEQELTRLTDGSNVLYDASNCVLHHLPLERQTVPIHYGFPNRGLSEQRSLKFPSGRDGCRGGCSVNPAILETRAWVCPDCLKAEAEAE